MERGRYSKYEDAKSNPPLEVLQQISGFFRISIDLLVSVDLRRVPFDDLQNLSDATILFVDDGRGGKNKIIIQKPGMKLK
jgi:transcriptional regulator with XRE-family HTH domain